MTAMETRKTLSFHCSSSESSDKNSRAKMCGLKTHLQAALTDRTTTDNDWQLVEKKNNVNTIAIHRETNTIEQFND
jgi:hypothetical protein